MAESTHQRKKNPLGLWLGAGLIVFGMLAVVSGVVSLTDNKTRLIAPKNILSVEVASTDAQRQLGLSGRANIDNKEGMLFVFDQSSVDNCFWMKDMLTSIDMVWLDEEKNVVSVKEGVPPESYPESFCPTSPAKYGLELSSGNAAALGIAEGVKLRF